MASRLCSCSMLRCRPSLTDGIRFAPTFVKCVLLHTVEGKSNRSATFRVRRQVCVTARRATGPFGTAGAPDPQRPRLLAHDLRLRYRGSCARQQVVGGSSVSSAAGGPILTCARRRAGRSERLMAGHTFRKLHNSVRLLRNRNQRAAADLPALRNCQSVIPRWQGRNPEVQLIQADERRRQP